jgi:16S rRNA (cytosine1402-N4)-methyltransferase
LISSKSNSKLEFGSANNQDSSLSLPVSLVSKSNSITNFHIPVLLEEVKKYLFKEDLQDLELAKTKELNLFDGTLGGGSYTQQFINSAIAKDIHLNQFSSDLDSTAIERVLSYIQVPEEQNLEIRQGNFADVITQFEDCFFDGITLDLGFSSNQLEESGRGFAYLNREENLDLRYDTSVGNSASYLLLNLHNWQQLGKVIYEFSGEDLALRIAKRLYETNKKTSWLVGEFVDLVISVIPFTAMKRKNQILSRVWQALRIWVNGEFDSLNSFLPVALDKLKPNGRLVVVSFHSLEDKIITKYFREKCKPISEDDYGKKEYQYKLLTTKPVIPTESELTANPRSRSAVLRVLEKVNFSK